MNPPRIIGLDLSLTRTGVTLPGGTTALIRPRTRGCERLIEIRDAAMSYAVPYYNQSGTKMVPVVDLVVIEGFSYGSKGRAVFDIGGAGWLIRVALHEAGIPFVEVPPATLKKYATGRGNADKQAMQMAAAKRLGYDDDKPDDNIVDAMWLRALALDAYGYPVATVPQSQREVINGIGWPTLNGSQVAA